MFAKVDYLIDLAGGILFAGLSDGAADGGTGTDDQGRNHQRKGMVAAALEAGEQLTPFMVKFMRYDLDNGDLFGDQNEDQMKGKSRQENAFRFVQSVMKSINGKRKVQGKAPQEFSLSDDTATNTGPASGLITLSDFYASRFVGTPPPLKWLVANIFKLAAAYMLAGMGEIGKGFSTLHLAMLIAFSRGFIRPQAFGGMVMASGTSLLISCEDSAEVYWSRIDPLDPHCLRHKYPEKLMLISLPDVGGVRPFVVQGKHGFETTPFYKDFRRQLLEIPDLKFVNFDTMQGLFQCDFNADPAAGQYCAGIQQELATMTGACVVSNHHMRKPSTEITTPMQAREAIRGTTAIVDGLRGAYALWPAPDKESHRIASDLGLEWQSNLVVKGAIVKSNSAESRHVTTYIRNEYGLLEDRTYDLKRYDPEESLTAMVEAIRQAAASNSPFYKSGDHGVFKRRSELPVELRELSRKNLEQMVEDLETQGRIFNTKKDGITC